MKNFSYNLHLLGYYAVLLIALINFCLIGEHYTVLKVSELSGRQLLMEISFTLLNFIEGTVFFIGFIYLRMNLDKNFMKKILDNLEEDDLTMYGGYTPRTGVSIPMPKVKPPKKPVYLKMAPSKSKAHGGI